MSEGKVDFSGGMPAQESRYRDPAFACLFILHFLVVLGLLGFGVVSFKDLEFNDNNSSSSNMMMMMNNDNMGGNDSPIDYSKMATFGIVCLICAFAGGTVALFWVFLARRFPRQMIIGTLVMTVVMWLAFAGLMAVFGQYIGAIIFLVIALIMSVLWFFWRHRIPFAAAVLSTVATVLSRYKSMIFVSFLQMFFMFIFIILWGFQTFLVSATLSVKYSENVGYAFYVFSLFSFYWTAQVIRNVGHVACCGVYATWYFLASNMPDNPTMAAYKRAWTTSFGSICLGSLIVAIIQTVRALLRNFRRRGGGGNMALVLLACLAECLLGCIENLVRYFNKYAYTQVAIYGKSFCEAAKDTWQLVKSHGVDAIINDSLLGGIFTIGSLLGAGVIGLLGFVLGYILFPVAPGSDTSFNLVAILCGIVGLIIGYAMMQMTLVTVDSGVATIFVCFAMDPLALQRNSPELYDLFQTTYYGPGSQHGTQGVVMA